MTLRMSNHSKNVATSTGATLPKAMIVLTVTLLSAGGPADTNAFIINRFPGLAARIHRTGSAASVSHSIGQRPFEGSCPSKKRKSRVALLAGASKSPPPSSSSSQPASPAKGKKKPPPGSKRMSFAGGRVKTPTQQQKQQKAGETRKYEKPGEDEEEEEEDVKKSARWGFKPARSASASEGGTTTPKPGSRNPFRALKASFGALGQGATAAKDALYGAADAAGSLAEMRLKTESGSPKEQGFTGTSSSASAASTSKPKARLQPPRKGAGVGGALQTVAGGMLLAKDAFWGSVEALGGAVEAAKRAPDAARSVADGGKAAVEGATESIQAAARMPAAAAEGFADAVGSATRAATSLKDGAYEAADAVGRLAGVPAEMAKRRRRDEEVQAGKASKAATEQREAKRKLDSAVTGAKAAVWGTVEGVENLVDSVASAPAAVGEGFLKAQEAVASAGDMLGSIPRTVQGVPGETQKTVDGVFASITSMQDATTRFISGVKGGVDGVSNAARRATAAATGQEKREREERERREAEERANLKIKNAVFTFQGKPYTKEDLGELSIRAIGATAKGAFDAGRILVALAFSASSAPGKVAQALFGPFYNYRQSRNRVAKAVASSVRAKDAGLEASMARVQPGLLETDNASSSPATMNGSTVQKDTARIAGGVSSTSTKTAESSVSSKTITNIADAAMSTRPSTKPPPAVKSSETPASETSTASSTSSAAAPKTPAKSRQKVSSNAQQQRNAERAEFKKTLEADGKGKEETTGATAGKSLEEDKVLGVLASEGVGGVGTEGAGQASGLPASTGKGTGKRGQNRRRT